MDLITVGLFALFLLVVAALSPWIFTVLLGMPYLFIFFPFCMGCFLFLFTAFYLLPAICAVALNKKNRLLIVLCTILLGWSVIGWLICLLWSIWGVAEPKPAHSHDEEKGRDV